MNLDEHESFQRMIDQNLAGVISTEKEHSLREHLSACASCKEYLSASNRVIAGLRGFSFKVNPTLNARVLAALRRQMQPDHAARPHRRRVIRPYTVSVKVWAAFAVALSISIVGSALVYRVAKYFTVPIYFDNAQVRAVVLVFWLLPSLCAASCLLAAPVEKRGIA
jgi:predicted anti-sigma-YlaC factor YlaD